MVYCCRARVDELHDEQQEFIILATITCIIQVFSAGLRPLASAVGEPLLETHLLLLL